MKGKGEQKSRRFNIILISCPHPVTFKNYCPKTDFWWSKTPVKKIINMAEILVCQTQENQRETRLLIHFCEKCMRCPSYRKL